MPTCSYCGHEVGPNATSCPNCGERGEDWKSYDYVPHNPDPIGDAWAELIGAPLGVLASAAFIYFVVRFGIPIVVGVLAFLFAGSSRVNWDAVGIFAQVAGWLAAIGIVLSIVEKDDVRRYFTDLPENATRVLKSIGIFIGVIVALYLLVKIGANAFLK